MALSILDGTQTATTLSTILSSGQHITAHTVVSLGTQAITDMRGAVSGSVVSISNFPSSQTISGTVTANPTGTQTIAGTVTVGNTVTVSGTVNAGLASENDFVVIGEEIAQGINNQGTIPISGTVTIGSALPTGTNRIGVVTIGAGTVTIGAGTAQIGSVTVGNTVIIAGTVTANPTGTQTIAGTVTLGESTSQIGSVTVSNFGIFSSDEGGVQPDIAIQLGFSTETSPGEDYVRVAPSNPLPVTASGTVTANSSNGSLTTRFGSVTTANTAFATSAVTNANRKYLLIQNITTGSNVVTVGIGFTPTTTQGIQLFAGAGLTFEGSYIPTGAVNLLSSITASCYTILEA